MPVQRVLITNCELSSRAGTEQYVRDLSLALQRRGYEPSVFSPKLGEVAEEIRAAGVVVTDDLSSLRHEPDVVHGHHFHESIAAMSRFPDRPGLFVAHGAVAWQEEPPVHARLLRYVAVDEACLARVLAAGVPAEDAVVIPNGVDTARFLPRAPLPSRPRRALVLSNSASEENYVPALRAACARMGIELDVVGAVAGSPASRPEELLPRYDLVFAKARAAVEALAVGCAVIVTDAHGLAGMATYAALPEWRRWNLGRTLLTAPHEVDSICAAIDRYDPDDAARCRDFVRANWTLETMVDRLLAEYDAVDAAWDPAAADHRAELVSLAGPLSLLGPLRTQLDQTLPYVDGWKHELEQSRRLFERVMELEAEVGQLS